MRFRFHERRGIFGQNKFGKPFVDVSRLSHHMFRSSSKFNIRGVHAPFGEHICGGGGFVKYHEARFRIHHYIGTWEEFSSRKGDIRRTRQRYDAAASVNDGVPDDTIQPWLSLFVNTVGLSKATYLLEQDDETTDNETTEKIRIDPCAPAP